MGGRGYVGGKRGTPGSVSLETAALATHKFQKNGNHHFDEQILLGKTLLVLSIESSSFEF